MEETYHDIRLTMTVRGSELNAVERLLESEEVSVLLSDGSREGLMPPDAWAAIFKSRSHAYVSEPLRVLD